MRGAAQRDGARGRWPGLDAAEQRVQQVDTDEVCEPAHRHIGHLLGGARHVEGATHLGADVVQQDEPLPGPVLFGDVERDELHVSHLSCRVPQGGRGDGPEPFIGSPPRPAVHLELLRLSRLEHPAHALFHRAADVRRQDVGDTPTAYLLLGEAQFEGCAGAPSQSSQVGVVDHQRQMALREGFLRRRLALV
ncbi:hypothetical protein GCM10010271_46670 [Streptomyces kurssanovii]|nr:hypothetical protein GCM10010271_46670 [Streptomyces kurssanovii]